jgi:hypothetical protein
MFFENKSSLTSTVRNFSLIYLFTLFLTSTTRHVSAHPQVWFLQAQYTEKITDINGSVDMLYNVIVF